MSPVTCHVNLSPVHKSEYICQQAISQMFRLCYEDLLPTLFLLREVYDVFPLGPEGCGQNGTKELIPATVLNEAAAVLRCPEECIRGLSEPYQKMYVPLLESAEFDYLFGTCDCCKDYLVSSHRTITLPVSGFRIYARKSHYIMRQLLDEKAPAYIQHASESGRETPVHAFRKSMERTPGRILNMSCWSSRLNFCLKCQEHLLVHQSLFPIKYNESDSRDRYCRVLGLLDSYYGQTWNKPPPFYHSCPASGDVWGIDLSELEVYCSLKFRQKKQEFIVPCIKRAIPTVLESDLHQEVSCTEQSFQPRISPFEGIQNLSLDDLLKALKSKDESDEMFE